VPVSRSVCERDTHRGDILDLYPVEEILTAAPDLVLHYSSQSQRGVKTSGDDGVNALVLGDSILLESGMNG
jgi:hypothetical protein